jgi:sugar phosphate permease
VTVLAYTADTWTQIIVALSIFVPVIVAVALAVVVLRGKRNDPDEQRWARLAEQRREDQEAERRS